MRRNRGIEFLGLNRIRLAVCFLLLVLGSAAAYSQTITSPSVASLRGTAKLNGTVIVDGVVVVVISRARGEGVGKPVPARVNNMGEYRIEGIPTGTYELYAQGPSIKVEKQKILIAEGNRNIHHLILRRPERTIKVRGKVLDQQNQALKNKTVFIYSNELPPSICPGCSLAQVKSDKQGEIVYDLAADESYSFAVNMTNRGGTALKLIASDPLAIGGGTQANLELRFNNLSDQVLTATLLTPANAPQTLETREDYYRAFLSLPDRKHYETKKLKDIKFVHGTSELTAEAKQTLDEIAKDIGRTDRFILAIGSSTKSFEFPDKPKLMESQTAAIVEYLVKTRRVPRERIMTLPGLNESQAQDISAKTTINQVVEVYVLADKSQSDKYSRNKP